MTRRIGTGCAPVRLAGAPGCGSVSTEAGAARR